MNEFFIFESSRLGVLCEKYIFEFNVPFPHGQSYTIV